MGINIPTREELIANKLDAPALGKTYYYYLCLSLFRTYFLLD